MSPYYVLYVLLDPCPVCDMETSWRKTKTLSGLGNSSSLHQIKMPCLFFGRIFGFTKDHRETKNTAQK